MEIFDYMESFRRREEKRVKEELSQKFFLAQATAEHIGMYLNKENKARNLWDFFPWLFEAEKQAWEEEMEKEELEKAKERRRTYIAEYKRQREAGLR